MRISRDHWLIILAISLPLVLVAIFWLAVAIPRSMVDGPIYNFLIVDNNRNYSVKCNKSVEYDIGVVNKSIQIKARKTSAHQDCPTLWRINVTSGKAEKFTLPPLEDNEPIMYNEPKQKVSKWQVLPTPEHLSSLTLLTGETAPDGYHFEGYRSKRGSGAFIIAELFAPNNSRPGGITISKEGRQETYTIDDYPYYHNISLLGWVEK